MVEQQQQLAPLATGIPTEQWAIQVHADGHWDVEKVPVPRPQSGQVLVKIECAPINPSDTYFMAGMYGLLNDGEGESKFKFPLAPGWEGAGTVVYNGGGFMGWRLVGKRVAITKCQEPNKMFTIGGCYQQYAVTTAMQCIPLPDNVSFEQGSMHCVNPLTAIGMLKRAREDYKAQAVIQTAAASQLGRMVVRLAQQDGIPLINIVRKEEQVKILKDLGAEHVLNSTDADFLEKLRDLAKQLRATVCFEAIGGKFTGTVMTCMPASSTCMLYGLLSEQAIGDIDPLLLIGRN